MHDPDPTPGPIALPPGAARVFTAAAGVLDDVDGAREVVDAPWWATDAAGILVAAGRGAPPSGDTIVHDLGRVFVMPGLVNAHSHAFQRDIRGTTHRRGQGDPSSFWSWRTEMYAAAATYDPDGLYTSTRACFEEMLASGVTSVGEFHYVHHQPDGTPYDDPNRLSEAVIAAARDVGLRLCLLEVLYQTSAPGVPPLPEQRRFCDADVTAYLRRCEALLAARGPRLHIGLAPHSVRAVPPEALAEVARFAAAHDLVVHAHVSEQPAENEACQAAHGGTPLSVFERAGLLERPGRFTAVHAIHLDDADRRRLQGQQVCACPTTEADLGDGILEASVLLAGDVEVCLGSDSNSLIDLFTEAQRLELHERLATLGRLRLGDVDRPAARVLLDAATVAGARALGMASAGRLAPGCPFDAVALDLGHLSLRDVPATRRLDAIMLAGSAAPVRQVFVEGSPRL